MSDIKLISPLLDQFQMGDPISSHDGVRCCPAMRKGTDERYIVKIISIPASQTQLDALLLTGAYSDVDSALNYFKELAGDIESEVLAMQKLARIEGFLPFEGCQVIPMEDGTGYQVYLLSTYQRTLEKHFAREPMTHLSAVNLGLDLCAALAVCRKSGFLYTDLKPSNIYVTEDKEYRIGDLGFARLDSLAYASLPNKYRSEYTAPELEDAFATLNTTVDIYAVGLILYQAYNNGVLPARDADGVLPPPEFADYEMAEIILKACAVDPSDRWQDPIQMGQALVSYMQRNGVNDTPIVPVPTVAVDDIISAVNAAVEAQASDSEQEDASEDRDFNLAAVVDVIEADTPSEAVEAAFTEDDEGNLSFLTDLQDETVPGSADEEIAYEEVSDDLSAILAQVDELAAMEVPEPVVAPEPIAVEMPEPEAEPESEDVGAAGADEPAGEAITDDEDHSVIAPVVLLDEDALPEEFEPLETESVSISPDVTVAAEEPTENEENEDEDEFLPLPVKKKSKGWLAGIIVALLLLAIVAVGFLYYRNFYLMPIDSIQVSGTENTLVVTVDSDVDESLLKVVCSDSHGNQITLPVVDGKATFENLVPNTAYNIKVITEGFHRLTGSTATAYSTPAQTNIVQFSAVTGSEDGSVILGFTVEGPDEGQWSVVYSTPGETEQTVIVPSRMVTITGLTAGKEYTFRLYSDTNLYVTGTNELKYTVSNLVYAEDLIVTSFLDGEMSVSWKAPEGASVAQWTVRCYNDSDYNETIITADTNAFFQGLDHDCNYTVEVTAAGMSVSQRTFVAKNAATASDFLADHSDPNNLIVSWTVSDGADEEGWLLLYTIDGADTQYSVTCDGTSAVVEGVVPGADYRFTLQDANGTAVLCVPFEYSVPEATAFSAYKVTAEDMTCSLYNYKAPDIVFTNTFASTDRIYMKINLSKRYTRSDDEILILFVTRDADGNVIFNSNTTLQWNNLWDSRECILAIPYTPDEPGDYSICIYFNGQFITEENYTIENAAE